MNAQDEGKLAASLSALSYVKNEMIIGLGTGSTVEFFLLELSKKVRDGLVVTGIPTSVSTRNLAESLGISVQNEIDSEIDIDFDGADEVDSRGNLIKGGGGALTREKIVASNSKEMYVLVDESKISGDNLGRHSLPVEILPFMHSSTIRKLEELCDSCALRENFLTDNGNIIVDLKIPEIKDPESLERTIKMIPGVVEVGLFVGLATKVIVGNTKKSYEMALKK